MMRLEVNVVRTVSEIAYSAVNVVRIVSEIGYSAVNVVRTVSKVADRDVSRLCQKEEG